MSQRVSGYARKPNDAYNTPEWCVEALLPHLTIKPPDLVHEPATGTGNIAKVLRKFDYTVTESDINDGVDFLSLDHSDAIGIITNPPYGLAEAFIVHALKLMQPNGVVAMLLRTDYDHAATRRYLFDALYQPPFAKRVVLTKRIRWIENSTGSPSFNHSWFIWDYFHKGPPTIGYGP